MAGLIYLADVDDLDSSISSKFGQVYAKYGDNVMATLGIDIVQVRYTTTTSTSTIPMLDMLLRFVEKSSMIIDNLSLIQIKC